MPFHGTISKLCARVFRRVCGGSRRKAYAENGSECRRGARRRNRDRRRLLFIAFYRRDEAGGHPGGTCELLPGGTTRRGEPARRNPVSPEMPAPLFRWKDGDARSDLWLVTIEFPDGRERVNSPGAGASMAAPDLGLGGDQEAIAGEMGHGDGGRRQSANAVSSPLRKPYQDHDVCGSGRTHHCSIAR